MECFVRQRPPGRQSRHSEQGKVTSKVTSTALAAKAAIAALLVTKVTTLALAAKAAMATKIFILWLLSFLYCYSCAGRLGRQSCQGRYNHLLYQPQLSGNLDKAV